MVNKLTKRQIKSIESFYEEGMNIGLNTDTNKIEAEKSIHELYTFCGFEKPFVFWCQSPYQMQIIINILKETKWNQIRNQMDKQIGDQIWNQIGKQIRNQIKSQIVKQIRNQIIGYQTTDQIGIQICNQIENQIRNQIGHQIRNQIYNRIDYQIINQIRSQMDKQIWSQMDKQIRKQICNQIENQMIENEYFFYYGYSQNEINWIQYYRYFIYNFKNIKWNNKAIEGLNIMYRIAKYSGWWYPFEKIVFVCEKPIKIIFDRDKKLLHSEKESVIEYNDGYKLYALNGIMIPDYVIEKDKNDIDIKEVIKINNVEQKREIIKFLGEDWFYEKLDCKLLDTKYLYLDKDNKVFQKNKKGTRPVEYKLLKADIGFSEPLKILCMDNASIDGIKHYETVEPYCETILDAFESRTGIRDYPIYLS
jgi:hypothetical protein